MSRKTIIILVFLNITLCYAQNDTLYLRKDNIELRENIYNQLDLEGQKIGNWIIYELKKGSEMAFIEWDGDLWSGSETIFFIYRPLEIEEYYGIRKTITEKVDSSHNFVQGTYQIIYNKVPKESYYIKGKGKFKNNKKEGQWIYYHENGIVSRTIKYENGIPLESFKVFYNDKSLMIDFKKLDDRKWEVCKYEKDGSLKKREILKIEGFKEIY